MIGTWKWNMTVGLAAFLITFLTSLSHNEWSTSLVRGVYGFAVVFAAGYAVRFLLGTAAGMKHFTNSDDHTMMEIQSDSTGSSVDLSTPSDDALLHDILKQPLSGDTGHDQFKPLDPQRLVSKDKLDPETLAQSLRRMTEE